MATAKITTVLQ